MLGRWIPNIPLCNAYVFNKGLLWGLIKVFTILTHSITFWSNVRKISVAGNLFGLKGCHAFWSSKEKTHVKVRHDGNPCYKNLWRGNLWSPTLGLDHYYVSFHFVLFISSQDTCGLLHSICTMCSRANLIFRNVLSVVHFQGHWLKELELNHRFY